MDLSLVDALEDAASFFGDTDDVDSGDLDHAVVVTPPTPCGQNGVTDIRCEQSDREADDDTDALLTDPFDTANLPTLPHPGNTPLEEEESHSPIPPPPCRTPPPHSVSLHHSQSPLSHPHFAHHSIHAPLLQSYPSSPLQENLPADHLIQHAAIAHPMKDEQFEDELFTEGVIDVDGASAIKLAHAGRMDNLYMNANVVSATTGATRPVTKDKLAQRKQRNKESARRYREKQVARRRHLENYTRTLCEQNRELETLHDRLLSLTCERSFVMDVRGGHGADPVRSMYGYGVQPNAYSPNHATSPTTAYHNQIHAALGHNASVSHAPSQPAYPSSRSRSRAHHRSHLASTQAHVPSNGDGDMHHHHAAYLNTLESPSISHNMHSTLLRQSNNGPEQTILLPGSVHMQARLHQNASPNEDLSAHYGRAVYVHASTTGFDERTRTRTLAPSLSPSERHFATSGRL